METHLEMAPGGRGDGVYASVEEDDIYAGGRALLGLCIYETVNNVSVRLASSLVNSCQCSCIYFKMKPS